jgi:hypothetical protein
MAESEWSLGMEARSLGGAGGGATGCPHGAHHSGHLDVKANILHDCSDKRMAKCIYETIPMCFMIDRRANVGQLKARAIDWMNQRNFGTDWKLGNADNDSEAIDCRTSISDFAKATAD